MPSMDLASVFATFVVVSNEVNRRKVGIMEGGGGTNKKKTPKIESLNQIVFLVWVHCLVPNDHASLMFSLVQVLGVPKLNRIIDTPTCPLSQKPGFGLLTRTSKIGLTD